MSETAGFTRAYADAAAKGTANVEDAKAGVKCDHTKTAMVDPTQGLRERIALHLTNKLETSQSKKCLDVGCSTGGDLALLKKALQEKGFETGFEPIGVDLLGAQLPKAQERLPEGKFVEGDVVALPFEDGEMDSVQCSRVLVHIPDMSKAVDEMVRVLHPGGCGVFSEGNFHGSVTYTSDPRLKAVESARDAHILSMIAQPSAPMDAYKLLLARSDVENVRIEDFSIFVSDPSFGMGLVQLKPMLEALVAKNVITQEDMNYYFDTLPAAEEAGDFFKSALMLEVSFDKK
ncbi:hypothetical protein CYMTET_6345 [Cymbomonas tetramitiformis]|uniref:Methyltransferase type 11 domain-containing protein n=1 Tax=Cymbomonas tetramitiformis TaxID=36881 RepID=A0AAE0GXM4_9CHLO|nr:hypothetical protein CYMTET_6345 [Cymbomonas tetramitiformis]|eukprot:gene23125-27979_t